MFLDAKGFFRRAAKVSSGYKSDLNTLNSVHCTTQLTLSERTHLGEHKKKKLRSKLSPNGSLSVPQHFSVSQTLLEISIA